MVSCAAGVTISSVEKVLMPRCPSWERRGGLCVAADGPDLGGGGTALDALGTQLACSPALEADGVPASPQSDPLHDQHPGGGAGGGHSVCHGHPRSGGGREAAGAADEQRGLLHGGGGGPHRRHHGAQRQRACLCEWPSLAHRLVWILGDGRGWRLLGVAGWWKELTLRTSSSRQRKQPLGSGCLVLVSRVQRVISTGIYGSGCPGRRWGEDGRATAAGGPTRSSGIAGRCLCMFDPRVVFWGGVTELWA